MTFLNSLERCLSHPWAVAIIRAGSELRSVLLPVSCVACGVADESLCPVCAAALRHSTLRPFNAAGGAELLPAHAAQGAPGAGFRPLPVFAAGEYRGPLARVLLACKNHGHTDLTGVLATAMARALHTATEAGHAPLVLVPVPGSARAWRRRGYDPLRMILAAVQGRGLLPRGTRISFCLGYRRRTFAERWAAKGAGGQKALGARARRKNVHGTMRAGERRSLSGVRVLVADDVLTTGATMAEAVRALRAAGADVAGGVVIAAARAPSQRK